MQESAALNQVLLKVPRPDAPAFSTPRFVSLKLGAAVFVNAERGGDGKLVANKGRGRESGHCAAHVKPSGCTLGIAAALAR